MSKTVKVGVMPGRLEEYAVEVGQSIQSVLELAELSGKDGYEVKADGSKVTDLSSPVTESTNTILLTKQVKGNSAKTVKIGAMPGRITEYAVEQGTTYRQAIQMADLSTEGYEVKSDGTKVENLDAQISDSTNTILLTKQVKGNANGTVKIGAMPGRITEYAVEEGTTYRQAIDMAELSTDGYEVKSDGSKVENLDSAIPSSANTILLTKQVKGNK